MWLLTTLVALLIATAALLTARKKPESKKYRLDLLVLMLLGTFVMVLADHMLGFLEEGGPFIELETGGLIPNAFLLGLAMLLPIFIAWIALAHLQRKNHSLLPLK